MECIADKTLSAAELENLITTLPSNVCWKDYQGRYIKCNQAFADLLNLDSPADLVGKTDFDLLTKAKAEKVRNNDREVMNNNMAKDFVEAAIDKHGKETTYLSKKAPHRDEHGKVIGLICVAMDITHLQGQISALQSESTKKSEYIDQMQFLTEIAHWFPGNAFWKNTEGTYLGSNANMQHALPHSLIGKTIFDLDLAPEVAQQIHDTDTKVMKSKQGVMLEEVGVDKKGNEAIYLSSKVAMRNEKGDVIGLFGFSLDITDRVQMEQSLKEAKAAAETANQAKTEFIMNMSHDLRTPFNGILGFTSILLQSEKSLERHKMLSNVHNSAERLLSIIDELIAYVAADTKEETLQQEVDLRELIADLMSLMESRAKLKGLTLENKFASKIPPTILSQRFVLNRIFLNLLSNAIKYTNEGFVRFTADVVEQCEKNKIVLRLIVEDSGIGIAKKNHRSVFGKFARTEDTQIEYEGTGLGLYYVKHLVEKLNGTIEIDSRKGKGARFIIEAPFLIE